VIGIDPSLTGLGVIGLQAGENDPVFKHRFTSKPASGLLRFDRYTGLRDKVAKVLDVWEPQTAMVVIEAAPNQIKSASGKSMVEIGTYLQIAIRKRFEDRRVEVYPGSLKKFATGKGVGKKEIIAAHVATRWGQLFDSSDEFDAYVLAKIGLCYAGLEDAANAAQREVIEALRAGPAPKKPRKKAAEVDPNW
jgi:crossover junction endodeoxyribonuclease RuvC